MDVNQNILTIKDKVALITGAGQGVGRTIAHYFATYGAKVVVNDFFAERAEEVVDEISKAGGSAMAYQADITNDEEVQAMMQASVDRFGSLDILVNNAGNSGPDSSLDPNPTPFWESDRDEWEKFIGVNFDGVLNAARYAVPHMIENKGGRIVTIISDAGRVGEPFLVPYSGAKAGAAGFSRGLAKAVGRHNITVNNIALGAIRTAATADIMETDEAKRGLKNYTIRRFGETDDVAAAVLFPEF